MGKLIYSFVARGTVILCEFTTFKGNFNTVALQCLEKLPEGDNKYTFPHGAYTLNYLISGGFGKFSWMLTKEGMPAKVVVAVYLHGTSGVHIVLLHA